MDKEDLGVIDAFCFADTRHCDHRGVFIESFNEEKFDNLVGGHIHFCQDNFVKSCKYVLRGLHFQLNPYAQGKLVRCVKGEIFDVIVDLRSTSPTFLDVAYVALTEHNNKALWVPPGFAHGYLTLQDDTCVMYKVTQPYKPELQKTLSWSDPELDIPWPVDHTNAIVSFKDNNYDYDLKTLLKNFGYF